MAGIPLRIVDGFPDGGGREPGLMWRYPPGDIPGRESWWIVLPGAAGEYMEISWRTTDRASDPPHGLWDVTGTPPLITVSPSIDIERWNSQGVRVGSYWHGWIRDGVLVSA